ncbi:hypothetical protein K443DRAFT_676190 [Laccaria amethystina LaAM-08-1]|uniref:Transporter n=1 Tax=Laccaria amethystina LaAM-08-1 TaxID=1095629 RepID=A0A0C9Y2C1_9AGAR|nr:hypothetical protein K443DRAFT_676190 [Laccaria amethystina LaAM-08-1]
MGYGKYAGDSGTPFAALLVAVFNSILEVFLLCSAGYILASRGILDKKTQKQLNRLNVSLFTPALLFSKVAFFLTPEKLKELWVIPIFFAIVTCLSMTVGATLAWMFGLKRSQRSFVMAAAMFMNSNALPIALMQSIVVAVPDLAWGPDDNKNGMLGRALTYLTMYSTLGMVLRYSYGIKLLSKADPESAEVILTVEEPNERTPLLVQVDLVPEAIQPQPSTETIVDLANIFSSPKVTDTKRVPSTPVRNVRPAVQRRRTTFYNSFPNSPNDSRTNIAAYDSSPTGSSANNSDTEVESDLENAELLPMHAPPIEHSHTHRRPTTFFGRCVRRVCRVWATIRDFMTVPMWAALLSLIVACVQPLQHSLEFHMLPLNGAINSAGKCAVPLTLVVLGAYFYPPPPEGDLVNGTENGHSIQESKTAFQKIKELFGSRSPSETSLYREEQPKPGETKTVFLAVAARMIITPILLMPLVFWATYYDFHAVFEDPVFVVCNVILLSSPPALTLAQITQAVSGDAFERLISRTIFWSYCIFTPPITIVCVVIGLLLARL